MLLRGKNPITLRKPLPSPLLHLKSYMDWFRIERFPLRLADSKDLGRPNVRKIGGSIFGKGENSVRTGRGQ
jgi:hypothetical protein